MACVSDQDCSLLDAVSRASIAGTPVDGVLVVEAPASRVELDNLVTHCNGWTE